MSTLTELNKRVNELVCKSTISDIELELKRLNGIKVYIANINQHLSTIINYIDKSLYYGVLTEQPSVFNNDNVHCFEDEFESLDEPFYVLFLEAFPFGYISEGYKHRAYDRMCYLTEKYSSVKVDIDFFDTLVCKKLESSYPDILRDIYHSRNKITFLILSGLGNDKILSKTIENLVNISEKLEQAIEFIVVLNGCPDMSTVFSVAQLQGKNFKIINMAENQGISGGFQAGLNAVDTEFVFFFQDDIYVNDHLFVEHYLNIMEDESVGLIGGYSGSHLYKDSHFLNENNSRCFTSKNIDVNIGDVVEVDCVLCHLMCYRKSVGASFDMNYNPNGIEDIDFSLNVRQKNHKVMLSPVKMENLREEGVTRKYINPLITRKYHYKYFYSKHYNLLRVDE